jgi:exodeoxyribonuclease VII small subunit
MDQKDLTYETAYEELKTIAAEIENESVPVDILAEKVKRASLLIEFCQQKLRSTETEVTNIIRQMEKNTSSEKDTITKTV